MGLIQEVQALNNTNKQIQSEYLKARKEAEIATKKANELAKKLEIERQQKKEYREYKTDIKKALEMDFTTELKNYINKNGYKKSKIDLYKIETRTEIINKIATNDLEYDFLDSNYEKFLNKILKIYNNDELAKNKKLTQQLKGTLEKSGNIELAKKFGYKTNKIYSIEDINELTNKIQEYTKNLEQKKEEEKGNIFIGVCRFIGLIIKWIFLILFGGFYLIIKVLTGLAK